MQTETLRLEFVRCGKSKCHCMKGSIGHGPYWYAYRHDKKGMHKRYVGKLKPGDYERQEDKTRPEPANDRFKYDGRPMDLRTALRIFGFESMQTQQHIKTRYRSLMWEHHPDRGGSNDVCAAINAAYEYLTKP